MLVDIDKAELTRPPLGMGLVLSIISEGNGPTTPEHIGTGMYRLGHWNFEEYLRHLDIDRYPESHTDEPEWDCVGVCDQPEQVIEKYPFLVTSQRRFVVALVEIRKDAQPASGGWRWHKWGTYIGDQDPQREYLYDEPTIEVAWTFHIYEVKSS